MKDIKTVFTESVWLRRLYVVVGAFAMLFIIPLSLSWVIKSHDLLMVLSMAAGAWTAWIGWMSWQIWGKE